MEVLSEIHASRTPKAFFKEMLSSSVEPDGFTFASVFASCAQIGALYHASWAHHLMVERGSKLNSILRSALTDMYSKCGKIETAIEVFSSIILDNVSVWNSIMNGLAIRGLALEATEMFSAMDTEKVSPDSVTFVVILTACSHCGLVTQGHK